MTKNVTLEEIYQQWYKSLSYKKKKFMDAYNERATTASEFRKKKRALGKTLHKHQKYIDISKKKS